MAMYSNFLCKNTIKITLTLTTCCLFIVLCILFSFQSLQAQTLLSEQSYSRQILQEEEELLKNHSFVVAYNENHKPFQYTNKDGEAAGIVVDMMNALAQNYGFNVEYREYELREARERRYDIIITSLIGLNELNLNYQSTIAYNVEKLMMIFNTKLTLEHMKSTTQSVGVLKYPLSLDSLRVDFPKASFVQFQNSDDLLNAYTNNEVEGALFSRLLLESSAAGSMAYARNLYESENIIVETGIDVKQSFYISNDIANKYLPIFNALLSQAEYVATRLDEVEPHLEVMPFDVPNVVSKSIVFGLAILLLACATLFTLYKLFIKRKQATQALDSHIHVLSKDVFMRTFDEKLANIPANTYALTAIDVDLFKIILAYDGHKQATKLMETMGEMLFTYYENDDAIIMRDGQDLFFVFARMNENQSSLDDFIEQKLIPQFSDTSAIKHDISFSVGSYHIDDIKIPSSDMVKFCNIARMQGKNIHSTTFYTYDKSMGE